MKISIPPAGSHRTPRSPLTDHGVYHEPLALRVLDGVWPADLRGHVFVTAPEIATGVPIFGSDGMLYRFDLSADGVVVRSASTRTPSGDAARVLDRQRSRRARAGRFRQIGLSRLSPTLGAVECLSVAPIFVGDQLWVTSDAGRPWRVDPHSLRLQGPLGDHDTWRPVAPMPWLFPLWLTSGHPAVDPGGVAWGANFSTMSSPGYPAFARLIRLVGAEAQTWQLLDDATGAPARIFQSVHQMASTSRHIVLLDAAFHVEAKQLVVEGLRAVLPLPRGLLASFSTEAQSDRAVFWVIDKAAIDPKSLTVRARRYELEGEATHFAAAWNEPAGAIELIVLHTPCQDVSEWIRGGERVATGEVAHPDLVGMPAGVPMAHGAVGLHKLHPDGRVDSKLHRHDPATWGPALFTLPPGHVLENEPGLDHFWYYTAGIAPDALPERLLRVYKRRLGAAGLAALPLAEGRPPAVVHFDARSGDFDVWCSPPGWGVFGMCFVPRAGADSPWDGYLFASALSDPHDALPADSRGDEIWIFDAQRVADGPICRLAHPQLNLPFTLHTTWIDELPAAATAPADPQTIAPSVDAELRARIHAWSRGLPAPRLIQRALAWFARRAIRPGAVGALLDAAAADPQEKIPAAGASSAGA